VSARAPRRGAPPALHAAAWLLLLFAALSLVIWRQSSAVQLERALRQLESERAVAETQRVEATRRIQQLSSRARVVPLAQTRLEMHLPGDGEIVLLPVPADAGTRGEAR
jgi:cell division protein FtsL